MSGMMTCFAASSKPTLKNGTMWCFFDQIWLCLTLLGWTVFIVFVEKNDFKKMLIVDNIHGVKSKLFILDSSLFFLFFCI